MAHERIGRTAQVERLEARHLMSANPIINEFLASNDGVILDQDGDASDFIELYNQGDATANLEGWYLTDNDSNLTKWELPAVSLTPGQYLVVFASGKDRSTPGSELHTNFSLAAEGEYLALVQPDGTTIASEFAPTFPPQLENVSYGVSSVVNQTQVVGPGSSSKVLIPSSGTLGTTWTNPAFVDASWESATLGVGFTGVAPPPASTTVLQVDFNDRDNQSGTTQSGFSSFVMSGSGIQTGPVTRTFGAQTVTVTDVSGFGYDDRRRTTPVNAGTFTDSQLLRDFIFSQDASGTSGFDVGVNGLTPNAIYTVTVWSFGSESNGLRTSHWSANGVPAGESYSFDGAVMPTANETYRFGIVVAADSLGKITLEGRRDEDTNSFAVFLNALRVETGNTLHPPATTADVVRVDFNSKSGGELGGANTEAGYSTMSLDENGATLSGFKITFSAFGGATLDDRDHALPAASGAFGLDQVYGDFIFSSGTAGSGMEITVSGLAPYATYDLILRSFDSAATGARQATWTEVSSGSTITLASPYSFNGTVAPTTNDQNVIRASLVASATGTLVLRGTQIGGDASVVVNALELTRATFNELVGTNVEGSMQNVNSSAYVRAPFTVSDLAGVAQLMLDIQYDSGFVVYLNGQEVARRNAPTVAGVPPAFNAAATLERNIVEVIATETIDLTAFKNLLVAGSGNVLAIHGLNSSAANSDFLLSPALRIIVSLDQSLRYFATPSPGAANGTGFIDYVAPIIASHDHGFYTSSFNLSLNTTIAGTSIYYTYDGSIPTPGDAATFLYSAPIVVDKSTIVRARAFRTDYTPSPVVTQSYIFLSSVLSQTINPNNPAANPFGLAYPAIWQANAPGDFNIDPAIVSQWEDNNPSNTDFGIREALMSIPTMSIVMDHDDLWNSSNGIYPNATSEGDAWRRAGSIEYINPATGEKFQYNAGVQMHGGASRDNVRLKKHSFRIAFSGEYDGPGTLEFPIFEGSDFADINTLVLKGAFTDSFPTRTSTGRYSPLDSTYTRDVFMLDSQRAMGSLSPNATYVHLYINGLYWGLYYPAERVDDAFLASHVGGEREDWDVIKDFNELFRGNADAWNGMFSLARQLSGASSTTANAIYHQLQGRNADGTPNAALPAYLDVDNLIDYMVLHLYAGVEDWPSHNWVAGRNRVNPGKGFQFFTWDQEISFDGRFRDRTDVSNAYTPAELYSLLRNSSEFRLRFADRVQKHMLNPDGALTVASSTERWLDRADQVEAAIIGESARWGDARAGEVVNVPPPTTIPTMTVNHWRNSVQQVIGYFPQSHSLAISRFTADGLFTTVGAPQFSQFGGEVSPGFQLSLTKPAGSPASAEIYYTLDGSDPRLPGGGLGPSAILYSTAVTLPVSDLILVNARIRAGSSWSPIVETAFTMDIPTDVVLFNGGNYLQDFDGMPNAGATTLTGRGPHEINGVLGTSGMPGWQMSNFGGSSGNTEFRAQDGSQSGGSGRGVISFGSSSGSDRALGVLATSNQISRFGAALLNTTGETFTSFTLSYTGEQWRRGEAGTHNSLLFAYAVNAPDLNAAAFVDVSQLNFTAPNVQTTTTEVALDGNAVGNRSVVTFVVSGISWAPGQKLFLRWTGQDLSGQDDGLAIDDVSFTAAASPAHPGDFDSDGDVDGADFVAWQTNFPKADGATLAQGDADGDGDVDGADFVVWQTNFPYTPAPATAGGGLEPSAPGTAPELPELIAPSSESAGESSASGSAAKSSNAIASGLRSPRFGSAISRIAGALTAVQPAATSLANAAKPPLAASLVENTHDDEKKPTSMNYSLDAPIARDSEAQFAAHVDQLLAESKMYRSRSLRWGAASTFELFAKFERAK